MASPTSSLVKGGHMKLQLLGALLALFVGNAGAQDSGASCPATPKEEQAVLAALKSSLKDPDSAKISNVKVSAAGKTVCGLVNAKNSYGGYSGDSVFYVMVFAREAGDPVYAVVGVDSGRETGAATICAKDGVKIY
jgi:hypothetical protein